MTFRGKESLTEAEIGDPMEDTRTGTEGTEMGRTHTNRITGAAQDVVWVKANMLVGEDRTVTTAEADVREGVVLITPPPPHQDGNRQLGSI